MRAAYPAAEQIGEIIIAKDSRNGKTPWDDQAFHSQPGEDTGATQRVRLDGDTNPRRRPQGKRRKKKKAVNSTVIIVILCVIVLALVAAIVITALTTLNQPTDSGLILNNVYIAGVNIGGMTQSQAKEALRSAAENTYAKLDMTVEILGKTINLSPKDTGAKLDINAAVKAAYEYGRTGTSDEQEQAQNNAANGAVTTISVLPYLNLDTQYIQGIVDDLGETYSTLLSHPTDKVEGTRPPMQMDEYDTTVTYQTLYLFVGTAEYNLSTDDLMDRIMDAYESNIFHVEANCTMVAPDSVDVDALYEKYCITPVDADIDGNYNVTLETYGYGFDLEQVRAMVANAEYGQTLQIPLTFIRPDITAEDLAGNLFQDTLGTFTTIYKSDDNKASNIRKVVALLNGRIIKSGETFSFNEMVGEPTVQRGYKKFMVYVDDKLKEIAGGGISQVSSTLYTCLLQADLDILQRYAHYYAPDFTLPGLDADVQYGSKDLKFRNNTPDPIRILATYEGGNLTITLIGTDTKEYTVEVVVVTDRTYEPSKLFQTMYNDNPGGYLQDQVLQTPITGYDVSVYLRCTPKPVETDPNDPNTTNPTQPSTQPTTVPTTSPIWDPSNPSDGSSSGDEEPEVDYVDVLIGQTHYSKRNELVVDIIVRIPDEPDPSDPSDPSDPGNPSEPVDSSTPSEPVDSSTPSEPVDSSTPSESAAGTESSVSDTTQIP